MVRWSTWVKWRMFRLYDSMPGLASKAAAAEGFPAQARTFGCDANADDPRWMDRLRILAPKCLQFTRFLTMRVGVGQICHKSRRRA